MCKQLCEHLIRTLGQFDSDEEAELALTTSQVNLSVHRLDDLG